MKRSSVFLIVLAIALLVYFWREPSSTDHQPKGIAPRVLVSPAKFPPPRERPKIEPMTKLQQNNSVPSLKPATQFLTPESRENSHKNPPQDAVPFKNEHGLAIAYGDVILGKLQDNVATGYVALPDIQYWPSSTIRYHIQPDVQNPERILKALKYLSDKTVLQFLPYEEGVADAIVFEVTNENCYSYVGRISGTQPIFVSPECQWQHITHEILHALGFIHEHSRPDRDQYIAIQWSEIPEIYQSQFELLPTVLAKDWLKYSYDPSSIMHYGSQILKPQGGGPSLLTNSGEKIPEPKGLSPLDIQKISDLFNGR